MNKIIKGVLSVSILLGVAACIFWVVGLTMAFKISLILFFLLLSLGVAAIESLKGFAFSILIFAVVSASMAFPEWFIRVGDYQLKGLIIPLLILIMFGMGTAMSFQDFVNVVKMPKGVLIGLLCQFTIMPLVGFMLVSLTDLPPEIAAGVILVGCSPSGLASNVMAYISGANLALSLTLTAVATLMAPVMTPFLMKMLADQLVPIEFMSMLISISQIVLLPIGAGIVFNHFAHGKFPWLDRLLPIISMAGIAIIITVITVAGRDSLMQIGFLLIVIVLIHNCLGYSFGYLFSWLFGMDKKSCRTIAIEVGMQNSGLASGIALQMGKVATMGLAPAVFGPLMNITGSSLATWWRGKPVDIE
ncbi:MAG: BASS family bile acid:Na+ symporter [Cyclobacteriaceae bacterium]|jgi:BASS family bile acid:Na+ symporter